MQEQFLDRILTCVDCHGEFIFTAGEQLFFFDKQFKNDPKRCKPCKSRRSGLAAAANGAGPAAAGLSRTETRTQCSDCGIETTVPFKPTQGRPVLCRQCFQLKNRAAAAAVQPASSVPAQTLAAEAATLAALSSNAQGATLSPDAALLAASSMAAASPKSSVATSADLAYVASLSPSDLKGHEAANQAPIHTQAQRNVKLIAKSPAELLSSTQPELQSAAIEVTRS
jgi:CxxC-x17-CxxC domain-containing protein